MNRKIMLFSLAIVAVLVILVLGGYYQYKSVKQNVSPLAETAGATPTPKVELTTWNDPSQFSFQYPKELSLNPHDEDKVNYAHVELSSATHSGNLIVWTKDTPAADIESWAKQTKVTNPLDTTLGDQSAKKVLSGTSDKKLTTSTIYNGYLYQVEANLADSAYWNKVYDTVVSSFKFTPGQDISGSANTSDQGVSDTSGDTGEEVIE